MRNVTNFTLNLIFFGVVILIAFAVATIALTKKVNEYRLQNNRGIIGSVEKEVIPILSYSKAVVKKVHVKTGEEVKKRTLLIELDNDVLRKKIEALEEYPDNMSAQTEAKVAREELKTLQVYSPADSIIGDINVEEGFPVEGYSKLLTVYSNRNIQIIANLNLAQYQQIKKLNEIKAYSPRLNQNFVIVPELLKPNATTQPDITDKKRIGLYFSFKNEAYAKDLLHDEDLELRIENVDNSVTKPIDVFVNFWNGMIGRGDEEVL